MPSDGGSIPPTSTIYKAQPSRLGFFFCLDARAAPSTCRVMVDAAKGLPVLRPFCDALPSTFAVVFRDGAPRCMPCVRIAWSGLTATVGADFPKACNVASWIYLDLVFAAGVARMAALLGAHVSAVRTLVVLRRAY